VDRDDMVRRVAAARVGRLATVDAAGRPHLVPVCFALVGDETYTGYTAVDDKPKRSTRLRRVVNVAATGVACLLVDEYDEDWTRLWWVRLDCRARVVTERRQRQADLRHEARARVAQLHPAAVPAYQLPDDRQPQSGATPVAGPSLVEAGEPSATRMTASAPSPLTLTSAADRACRTALSSKFARTRRSASGSPSTVTVPSAVTLTGTVLGGPPS
jgi:PPOX class probable F420-dependent enzyme